MEASRMRARAHTQVRLWAKPKLPFSSVKHALLITEGRLSSVLSFVYGCVTKEAHG